MSAWLANVRQYVRRWTVAGLKGLVRVYQIAISPMMANHCRFEPTCSRYALLALEQHGPVRGVWLAAKRIGRCRPGVVGGWDPVPTRNNGKDAGHASCVCASETASKRAANASCHKTQE